MRTLVSNPSVQRLSTLSAEATVVPNSSRASTPIRLPASATGSSPKGIDRPPAAPPATASP